ncbi:MAG: tetratricopeptide repeat protein [Flavobacteriaceae bacterium]
MTNKTRTILLAFLGGMVLACSTQKNNLVNREYHALNTKFNVLFNGKEALEIGKAVLYQNNQDNFLAVLPVEPIVLQGEDEENKASIPSFNLAEEKAVKAIQKHSMNIGGKQRNRQIQDAYLLLGKARYFDRRFLPALEAFNYLLEGYFGNEDVYYEARLWREKTNLRLRNNALVVDNLKPLAQRIPFGAPLFSDVNATLAQAYINLKNQDSAAVYISQAALAEKDKTTKARYRYIEAQLLERAHLIDSARQAFQTIVSWKRKAPRIFWMQAKLQTIRLQAQLDSVSPLPALERLSKLFENQPYLHLIHQQEARYLLSQKQDSLALSYFNKSLRSPNIDTSTQIANYRELADYYFQAGGYVKTGAYLDSLLRQIPEEGRFKMNIQRERDGLDEVIALEQVIRSTDSILSLAAMTKEEQLSFFQNVIDEKRAKELAAIEEDKKGFFSFGNNPANVFYFYNERLVVQGKQAFLSTWGNRPNSDNWNRQSVINSASVEEEKASQEQETASFFIETPDFFVEQIPTDTLALAALRKDRRQAYLDVGIIYKEKFKNNPLALSRLDKVFQLKPSETQEVSALYHTFKILENTDPERAISYRTTLLERYPDSPFAQIVKDPENFKLEENQSPSGLYERAYRAYLNQEFQAVLNACVNLEVIVSGTPLAPKVAFLKAITLGRLDGEEAYIQNLKKLVELYPNAREANLAITTLIRLDEERQLKFKPLVLNTYKWVLSFPIEQPLDQLLAALRKSLDEEQKQAWKITQDAYSRKTHFIVIHSRQQLPETEYFLKKWAELPNFEQNVNNFVLLSAQYEQIQRFKSWEAIHKTPQE